MESEGRVAVQVFLDHGKNVEAVLVEVEGEPDALAFVPSVALDKLLIDLIFNAANGVVRALTQPVGASRRGAGRTPRR